MLEQKEMDFYETKETAEDQSMSYAASGIDERILRAVTEMGFETMTPIQEQAIPVLLEGRDVIGQAQTGTGKTAAFGIPMLQRIDENNRNLQGMILCPTRELAIQAAEELRKFSRYMHGIRMVPIYGGQDITRQIKALKGGAQIIVGTPGRVMDHMRRHTIKLNDVKMVVLDEADEMLNMGFREDMETILSEIENEHQTALFSATMPQAILDITDEYQKDALLVKVTKKELTIPLVKQYYFAVKNIYKEEVTSRLLEMYDFKRSIIFCNTKRMVDELAENLKKRGYQAEGLHGDMTQKQRDFVMNRFKSGNLGILIATDVAARGIDVDDLEAVFNYDVPQDIEYYVHRIGRTGRAGKEGMAFTFAYGRELYRVRDIERVCKTRMTEMKIPKASQIMEIKINKVINNAAAKATEQDLTCLQELLEEKLTELALDPMEILAALIKLQAGEEIKEIIIEEPRRRSSMPDGRRSSRGREESTGYGRRGNGRRDEKGRKDDLERRGEKGRKDDLERRGEKGRKDDLDRKTERVRKDDFERRSEKGRKDDLDRKTERVRRDEHERKDIRDRKGKTGPRTEKDNSRIRGAREDGYRKGSYGRRNDKETGVKRRHIGIIAGDVRRDGSPVEKRVHG